jgi:tetratricopeptide (TPR) repeat protein
MRLAACLLGTLFVLYPTLQPPAFAEVETDAPGPADTRVDSGTEAQPDQGSAGVEPGADTSVAHDRPLSERPRDDDLEIAPVEQPPAGSVVPAATAAAGAQTLPAGLGTIASDLDLVQTQIEAREYDAAQVWLEGHVRELEGGPQRYDPELIRPLTLLGDVHMGKGEYADALRNYQRATHLTRVTGGLKSLDQVELVYREATAYKAMGAVRDASDREEYAYRILAQNSGPADPALLPALHRLAGWYLETGNHFAARQLYERALRIHDAIGEIDSPAAIPALQGLAITYRRERFPADPAAAREQPGQALVVNQEFQQQIAMNNFPAGEEALQQVVRIRQATAANDPMHLVEAVLDLADWYTLFDKPARAEPLYAHAHELLAAVPDTDPTGYFAQPRMLYMPEPGVPRGARDVVGGETRNGYIELGYDVSETGYVRNLQTLASEPDGYMDLRARRSMRVARFRPALVDGAPIASPNQTHRIDFTYEAEPEPVEQETSDVADDGGNQQASKRVSGTSRSEGAEP